MTSEAIRPMTTDPATVRLSRSRPARRRARCNDGKAVADTDAKADQKLVDRPAGANGGKGCIAQHVAHDHGIHVL